MGRWVRQERTIQNGGMYSSFQIGIDAMKQEIIQPRKLSIFTKSFSYNKSILDSDVDNS